MRPSARTGRCTPSPSRQTAADACWSAGEFNTPVGTALANLGQVNANGTADASFDPDALSSTSTDLAGPTPCSSIVKGTDGAVHVVRFLPDGSGQAMVGGAFAHVGSTAQSGLVRVLPTGKVDANFSRGGTSAAIWTHSASPSVAGGFSGNTATLYSLDFQDDGKLVVGGAFTQVSDMSRNNLVRVHDDAFFHAEAGRLCAMESRGFGSGLSGGPRLARKPRRTGSGGPKRGTSCQPVVVQGTRTPSKRGRSRRARRHAKLPPQASSASTTPVGSFQLNA